MDNLVRNPVYRYQESVPYLELKAEMFGEIQDTTPQHSESGSIYWSAKSECAQIKSEHSGDAKSESSHETNELQFDRSVIFPSEQKSILEAHLEEYIDVVEWINACPKIQLDILSEEQLSAIKKEVSIRAALRHRLSTIPAWIESVSHALICHAILQTDPTELKFKIRQIADRDIDPTLLNERNEGEKRVADAASLDFEETKAQLRATREAWARQQKRVADWIDKRRKERYWRRVEQKAAEHKKKSEEEIAYWEAKTRELIKESEKNRKERVEKRKVEEEERAKKRAELEEEDWREMSWQGVLDRVNWRSYVFA
ncbi:MAG: hypothetical protein MMC33_008563 [Icmadophila ericetorum]|nr:hypothetical protein [Icmadophila ericetorum]